MSKSKLNTDGVLFKIDVKICQRIITMNVNESDTIVGLLQKHSIINHFNLDKVKELREKIKMNIQKQIQIKMYSNQVDLANRMKRFLEKENQYQLQNLISQKQGSQQNLIDSQQTPFKRLFQKTQKFQSKLNSCVSTLSNHQNQTIQTDSIKYQRHSFSLKQSTGPINQIYHLDPKHMNLQQFKNKPNCQNKSQSKNKESIRKIGKVDQDLLKAYEVILKKCKDKSMRQMAERTLKQLNIYQSQDNMQYPLLIQNDQNTSKSSQHFIDQCNQYDSKSVENQEEQKQNRDNKSIGMKQFSQSRSHIRKNNKYSYFQQKVNLSYHYENGGNQGDQKQYKYIKYDQNNVQNLKKLYHVQDKPVINRSFQPHRRFSYLDE